MDAALAIKGTILELVHIFLHYKITLFLIKDY